MYYPEAAREAISLSSWNPASKKRSRNVPWKLY